MPQLQDTPLMQQWHEVKSRHRDALILFRVGDFYEMFFGDAEEGARLLGLTLTSRNNGAAREVPLAGIPAKALDEYLARLVKIGRRVAICEQVEDPAQAKGLVRREVVETVTPGTILQDNLLSAKRNNFLVALLPDVGGAEEGHGPTEAEGRPGDGGRYGLAALDLSTGELVLQEVAEADLEAELGRLEPSEVLMPRFLEEELGAGTPAGDSASGPRMGGAARTFRDDWLFDATLAREELLRIFGVHSLDGFGFQAEDEVLVRAAGGLTAYVQEVRPTGVEHLRPPRIERSGAAMLLDDMTRRNLELVESLRPGEEGGTLLAVLDDTATAMGGRALRRWLLRPLVQEQSIWDRQESVAELFDNPELRGELRSRLREVSDLERISGRIGVGRVSPRELLGLHRSLAVLPHVQEMGETVSSGMLRDLTRDMDVLEDVRDLLEGALSPEAPATLAEGGVIREGYSDELDELRQVRDGARDFIASLQVREREGTGISSLKVGFNKVFGYYLEVTRANLDRVPDHFVRKQTLANAERYFTPELKEWEEKVFGAEDRILALESELFGEVRGAVACQVGRIQETGSRIAQLDVLSTLAEVSERNRFVRPEVHTGFEMEIRGGRHPVVEEMMPREEFIPNDLVLHEDGRIIILTGPNMAGKSTVLRQAGLIQLLAQIGAYVPADSARLPVCDRIFTRVGASDSLTRGQSTFMVEMNETASIIHGATDRSLVLLDEIGRGTSTYDGVSIAWAVTEHLHEHVGAKTIFATHYHELTQLGDLLPRVENFNVAVREVGEDVVFLRRLEAGGADRSYGIHVARLAGLPVEVLERAKELLRELEGTHTGGGEGLGRGGKHRPASEPPLDQLSLFAGEHPMVAHLKKLNLHQMTPLDALNELSRLKREVGGGEEDEE